MAPTRHGGPHPFRGFVSATSGASRSRCHAIGHTLRTVTPTHRRRRPCRAAAYRAVRRVPVVCATVLVPVVVVAVTGIVRNPTSDADLVLPLVAVVAAVAVAAYASIRRIRRTATRTTPGTGAAAVVQLDELDRRAQRLLVLTDDCVRTSR